jgi:hypothetical protein
MSPHGKFNFNKSQLQDLAGYYSANANFKIFSANSVKLYFMGVRFVVLLSFSTRSAFAINIEGVCRSGIGV